MSSTTSSTRRNGKVLVERITARVFCHPVGTTASSPASGAVDSNRSGGNPVTVFLPSRRMSQELYQSLAKQCSWESVIIESSCCGACLSEDVEDNQSSNSTNKYSRMSFYMPTGLQVSYCAHAAIGGAFVASSRERSPSSTKCKQQDFEKWTAKFMFTPNMIPDEVHTIDVFPDEACLSMSNTFFQDEPVSNPTLLRRVLSNHIHVTNEMLLADMNDVEFIPPTFRNVSVVRPKTLVYIPKLDDLRNNIKIPTVSDGNHLGQTFEDACGSIDDSTGLYLYSKLEDPVESYNNEKSSSSSSSSWEARQFPRASGYPEDPATGIAAAGLAACLAKHYYSHHGGSTNGVTNFNIYQGMSMDRPSLIQVVDMKLKEQDESRKATIVSFGLKGKVMIDATERLEISVDDE